jgi:hypothetical protein
MIAHAARRAESAAARWAVALAPGRAREPSGTSRPLPADRAYAPESASPTATVSAAGVYGFGSSGSSPTLMPRRETSSAV